MHAGSALNDSFQDGLLEGGQYLHGLQSSKESVFLKYEIRYPKKCRLATRSILKEQRTKKSICTKIIEE